jgi:hypothetical protein
MGYDRSFRLYCSRKVGSKGQPRLRKLCVTEARPCRSISTNQKAVFESDIGPSCRHSAKGGDIKKAQATSDSVSLWADSGPGPGRVLTYYGRQSASGGRAMRIGLGPRSAENLPLAQLDSSLPSRSTVEISEMFPN